MTQIRWDNMAALCLQGFAGELLRLKRYKWNKEHFGNQKTQEENKALKWQIWAAEELSRLYTQAPSNWAWNTIQPPFPELSESLDGWSSNLLT